MSNFIYRNFRIQNFHIIKSIGLRNCANLIKIYFTEFQDETKEGTSTNNNKILKEIKVNTISIETTQTPILQNINKSPKIIEKPLETLEINLSGKEQLSFIIDGDPLPHIEMWLEKGGNCNIIVPWRKVCFWFYFLFFLLVKFEFWFQKFILTIIISLIDKLIY